jgi:hypothetical protein
MPFFRYSPTPSPCKLCGSGFDHRQGANDPDLSACPTCGLPVVRQRIHAVNAAKILAPVSISSAKQAGFKVFKRISSGEFEKQ